MGTAHTVINNEAAGQFEIEADGGPALLRYLRTGDVLDLQHTEVPKPLEGQGFASDLARTALEYARAQHLKVKPTCRFVKAYLRRHPEFADLVASP
jgi:predicted GNAT family acetyltransferase